MDIRDTLGFYTQFDPRWFESPNRYTPSDEYLNVYRNLIPDSWQLRRRGIWFNAEPPRSELPDQGWKLHLSVSTEDTVQALQQALPVLRDEAVSFKFLLDPNIASLANGKLWPRQASGKFVTVYPPSLDRFHQIGDRLAQNLEGFAGPYILSDRRWPGSLCLHYRYGGFRTRTTLQLDGTRDFVIFSPAGELVVDERRPYWNPPDWVMDPFTQNSRSSEPTSLLCDGRFAITSALAFSSSGGIYKGWDNSTGQEVVLKEARPRVEIGRHRREAISVLKKEYSLLEKLADTGYFVEPVAFFTEWEHAFLVEQFVPGVRIGNFTIRNNPVYLRRVSSATVSDYLETMRSLWVQVARALAAAHDHNVILGDLSFNNIIVGGDSSIKIIDLETAIEESVDPVVGLYTPGMARPHSVQSGTIDRYNDYYALGMMLFGTLFLAHDTVSIHPPALQRFLNELSVDLGIPNEFCSFIRELLDSSSAGCLRCDTVVRRLENIQLTSQNEPALSPLLEHPAVQRLTPAWRKQLRQKVAATVDGIADYLIGASDTTRTDRLYPADPRLFETNPLSIAYGAAGVIYALLHMGREVPCEMLDWMMSHLQPINYPPGLYLGQAGIAWVLLELGEEGSAVSLTREALSHPLLQESANILHGAAGVGLASLKLWRAGAGDDFLDESIRVGNWLIESCTQDEYGVRWPDSDGTIRLGYAYGGSGVALFLLYLYLATDDRKYYSAGRRALEFEMSYAKEQDGKHIGFPAVALKELDNNSVYSHYWEIGTAGVCTTLIRYLTIDPDPALKKWRSDIEPDVCRKYTAFPPLFRGLAGLGNYLLDAWEFTGEEHCLAEAWQVAEGILLFRMERPEGIAFPGEQARRESADVATGSAGIGMFLTRLLGIDDGYPGNRNFVVDEMLALRGRRRTNSVGDTHGNLNSLK